MCACLGVEREGGGGGRANNNKFIHSRTHILSQKESKDLKEMREEGKSEVEY